jgi:hypothetical protein
MCSDVSSALELGRREIPLSDYIDDGFTAAEDILPLHDLLL